MVASYRFQLRTLFICVGVVALSLAIAHYWYRVPLRRGAVYYVICESNEWKAVTRNLHGTSDGDFTLYNFSRSDPAEIFNGVLESPDVWGPGIIVSSNKVVNIAAAHFRPNWNAPCLIDGTTAPSDEVSDQIELRGVMQESALPPRRCHIDVAVYVRLGIPLGTLSSKTRQNVRRLQYNGSGSTVMAYSLPINSDHVLVLILDLR